MQAQGGTTRLRVVGLPTCPGRAVARRVLKCHSRLDDQHNLSGSRDEEQLGSSRDFQRLKYSDWPQLAQVGLSTGFPVPIERAWPLVQTTRELDLVTQQPITQEWSLQGGHREPASRNGIFRPVFRASPFSAEARRVKAGPAAPTILFLDEGNLCRSVLAEAIMNDFLQKSPVALDIRVDSASLGYCAVGEHDARVEHAARACGLNLPPRSALCFDEVDSIVNTDLVLVMDRFDFSEVFREVAVLDKINPGGFYSSRIKLLGSFQPLATQAAAAADPDIPDPLYGDLEEAALPACIATLRQACRGLLTHLLQLQSRFAYDTICFGGYLHFATIDSCWHPTAPDY
ncbi:hypothetical protein WJX84_010618 [Apatococcus fuscideae]|uniref:protein-tyrosine-phosphatase n=1 Tax=Apatococcus fuscideae TaxID=2026836 RepID=A0AAW1SK49_9CHLO